MNALTSLEVSSPVVSQIIARHFKVLDGELWIDGVGVRRIVDEIGTPAYLYSQRALETSLQSLRASLSSRFDLHYSIKANPNQSILRFFINDGCGLEVASQGEIVQAVAAGCEPSRIVYAGPGKTDADQSRGSFPGLRRHADGRAGIAFRDRRRAVGGGCWLGCAKPQPRFSRRAYVRRHTDSGRQGAG